MPRTNVIVALKSRGIDCSNSRVIRDRLVAEAESILYEGVGEVELQTSAITMALLVMADAGLGEHEVHDARG